MPLYRYLHGLVPHFCLAFITFRVLAPTHPFQAGGGGDLNSFLRSLARDLDSHSGDRAAAALSMRTASDDDVRRILSACNAPRFEQTIATALSRSSWTDIVVGSLRATYAARVSREPEDAFRHADAAVVRLRELIEAEKDANWYLPIADMMFGQYRVAACQVWRASPH